MAVTGRPTPALLAVPDAAILRVKLANWSRFFHVGVVDAPGAAGIIPRESSPVGEDSIMTYTRRIATHIRE
jgi:hypothetical protein